MRPKPYAPQPLDDNDRYVRDTTTGSIWHRCRNRSLYADTDRSRVVYHSNYLRYFELGRACLMRDFGYPYREVEESGYVYPIVDLGITFFHPLYYDDPMFIYTRPVDLERVKIRFDYLITHGDSGELICKGYTIHCALNRAGKPTQVDPQTLNMWQTFQNGTKTR